MVPSWRAAERRTPDQAVGPGRQPQVVFAGEVAVLVQVDCRRCGRSVHAGSHRVAGQLLDGPAVVWKYTVLPPTRTAVATFALSCNKKMFTE